jgi:hypothetical protein
MARTPKITVTIPRSLQASAQQKSELKSAFASDAVRILRRGGNSPGNDIINVKVPVGSKKKSSKKAGKKK